MSRDPDADYADLLANLHAAGTTDAPADAPPEVRADLHRDLAFLARLDRAAARQPPFRRFGRFRLVEELGRGTFGVVFRAYDPLLHRDVALKIPHLPTLLTEDGRRRFLLEGEAAARLDHPNVVPVHEARTYRGTPYIVSAFCPGTTLQEWLVERTGPVPCREAAALVATLAAAAQHAHERGVVHRDLKPANVLVAAGSPKITDFGLAKLLDADPSATATGTVVGTPAYMAPEQAEGRRDVGPATDVWALGAILYELVAKRPAFGAATPSDTLHQVRFDEPPWPRGLPRDLEKIGRKCLAKAARERYLTAADLAADLDRFLRGEPVQARPVGPVARFVRACRRRPAIAGLTALLVIVVLGACALTFVQVRRAEQLRGDAVAGLARAFHLVACTPEVVETPALLERRTRELEAIAEEFERLCDTFPGRDDQDLWLVQALTSLGHAHSRKGDAAAAEAAYRRAADRAFRLVERSPEAANARVGAVAASSYYADVLRNRGKVAEALAVLRRGVVLTDALLAEDVLADVNHRSTIVCACEHRFLLETDAVDRDPALIAEHEHFCERYSRLLDVVGGPTIEERQWRASVLLRLGAMHRKTGRLDDGRRVFDRAANLYEGLRREEPGRAAWAALAGVCRHSLGKIFWDREQAEDAAEAFRAAAALREEAVRLDAGNATHRSDLAGTWHNLGAVAEELGRRDEAEAAYERERHHLLVLTRAPGEVTGVAERLRLCETRRSQLAADRRP